MIRLVVKGKLICNHKKQESIWRLIGCHQSYYHQSTQDTHIHLSHRLTKLLFLNLFFFCGKVLHDTFENDYIYIIPF